MSFQIFTSSIKDLDLLILSLLDHKALHSLLTVNSCTNSYLSDCDFWIKRIKSKYDDFIIPNAINKYYDLMRLYQDLITDNLIVDKHIEITEWMVNKNMKIGVKGANFLAEHGKLDTILKSSDKPDRKGITAAGLNKHYHVVKWGRDKRGIHPDPNTVIETERTDLLPFISACVCFPMIIEEALKQKKTDILHWCAHKNYFSSVQKVNLLIEHGCHKIINETRGCILPDQSSCDLAILNKHFKTVDWLFDRYIFPSEIGIEQLIANGHNELLGKFLAANKNFNNKIFSKAVEVGNETIVKLLLDQRQKPDSKDFEFIIKNGKLSLLKLFSRYQYYPTQQHINLAIKCKKFDILEWAELGGMLPDVNIANDFCGQKDGLSMLNWLADKNIFPNTIGANKAFEHKYYDNVGFLAKHEIFPDVIKYLITTSFITAEQIKLL